MIDSTPTPPPLLVHVFVFVAVPLYACSTDSKWICFILRPTTVTRLTFVTNTLKQVIGNQRSTVTQTSQGKFPTKPQLTPPPPSHNLWPERLQLPWRSCCAIYISSGSRGGGGVRGFTPPPFRGCLLVSIWKFPRTWTLNPPFEEFWPRTPPPLKEFLDPPLYIEGVTFYLDKSHASYHETFHIGPAPNSNKAYSYWSLHLGLLATDPL